MGSLYYSLLRRSVDEKLELGLQLIPFFNLTVFRDPDGGLKPLDSSLWGASDCENSRQAQQSLEGLEIFGSWNSDKSLFCGSYPIQIDENGNLSLMLESHWWSGQEIEQQINLAEEHRLSIGIAGQACSSIFGQPNAIIYADCRVLGLLNTEHAMLIETDGTKGWTYACIDFGSEDMNGHFGWKAEEVFGIKGSDLPLGTIVRHGRAPCYPSIINGTPVRKLSNDRKPTLFYITSLEDHGIYLNGLPCLTAFDFRFDENLEWCHTPEEDDVLFERSIADYGVLAKTSKAIMRHQPQSSELLIQQNIAEEPDIDLLDLLPQRLATALLQVKENLPYDSLCVLVSFLTGVASMLRLGTSVTGNEMTDYKVPVNLYTILRAPSGRKKSALQELFVNQPASDVMLRIAQENERMIQAWREQCRGQKTSDKPPQPVPVDIRINDYTGEAFVQALGKLDEVGRAVLIVREEIAALFESMNAYKSGKGADEQQLLELYDGRGFRSLRVGDKGRAFNRAAVNIYGTIQPDVLDSLLKNGDASGKWARFSFAAMPDMTKKLPTKFDRERLNAFKDAQQYLKDIISKVYELPAIAYKLDAEAMELFSEYELKKQEDALSAKISAQAALYGKSAGKVLRFAGLFHVLEIVVNNRVGMNLIPATDLQKAIDLLDRQDRWTLACHAKLAGVKTDSLTQFQRRLHNIALKSRCPMSWTDIRTKMSSAEKLGKFVADAEEAMGVLVTLGLGEISKGPNKGLYYKALKLLSS